MGELGSSNQVLRIGRGIVAYGATPVLRVESLRLRVGEVAWLQGANGSGKSSLFWSILGLSSRFEGEIRYLGRSLRGVQAHRRAAAGIRLLPQGRRVFGRLSVQQHLELAHLNLKPGPRDPRLWTPSPSGDPSQSASELSGGQAKLLLLNALAQGPLRLLLLDEPFAGLDPAACDVAVDQIQRCVEAGAACLFADHTGLLAERFELVSRYAITPSREEGAPFALEAERK